jgi:hypothetical protein
MCRPSAGIPEGIHSSQVAVVDTDPGPFECANTMEGDSSETHDRMWLEVSGPVYIVVKRDLPQPLPSDSWRSTACHNAADITTENDITVMNFSAPEA